MVGESELKLEDWVGRRQREQDIAAAAPVEALAATLDRDEPPPQAGDPIPLGWHWLYFLPKARQSEIGADGHPKRGGFLPPVTLPRRMFAGGRMTFHRPLLVGERIEREAEVASISEKEGRSGRLVFVTVRYRVSGERGPAVDEEQHLVYREAASAAKIIPGTPADVAEGDWRRTIEPDPVLLFRFSALTFNGHRIHYDHPYVTEIEGYPGLVVHGPLIAVLLLELCRDFVADRRPSGFWFQARRPLFVTAPFTLSGRLDADAAGCALQAADADGMVAMSGGATFAA